jgi:hypothetical protein
MLLYWFIIPYCYLSPLAKRHMYCREGISTTHNNCTALCIFENTLLLEEEDGQRCLVCTPACFPVLCQVLPRFCSTFFRRILPTSKIATTLGMVTLQLRFLLPTLLLDMKHDATDRFMRDSIRCCYNVERFFLLQQTMYYCRPKFSENAVVLMSRPWSSMLNKRRVTSLNLFIF